MKKILIIDDDDDISAMLYLLLRTKFDVAVIANSEDIFQKFRSFKPDIIMLDVFLKGYDGRVICKQLKFHPDSKHIPVIMVSGHEEIVDSISKYGADDFLLKPFDYDQLISKIQKLLAPKTADLSNSALNAC